jgi:hypothetical protein
VNQSHWLIPRVGVAVQFNRSTGLKLHILDRVRSFDDPTSTSAYMLEYRPFGERLDLHRIPNSEFVNVPDLKFFENFLDHLGFEFIAPRVPGVERLVENL